MIALVQPDNRIAIDTVLHGDALAVLKTMESDSVDAIVTDPPAGISFMGKEWDTFTPEYIEQQKEREKKRKSLGPASPTYTGSGKKQGRSSSAFGSPAHYAGSYDFSRKGRDAFIKFMTDIMAEALRVLKPGGHALVWALPRTSHWTALALEDAGFEIRDCVYHITGQGFPKSTAIDKQIDKRLGAERETTGTYIRPDGKPRNYAQHSHTGIWHSGENDGHYRDITAPATPEAAEWDGWGTALKPAVECWWLCRKPLAEPSIAANVLMYGTGGINVDACRVGYASEQDKEQALSGDAFKRKDTSDKTAWARPWMDNPERVAQMNREAKERAQQGRWPANLLLSHSWLCTEDACHPELCPIRLLDEQSGIRKGDTTSTRGRGSHIYANGKGFANSVAEVGQHIGYGDQGGASRYFTNLPPDVPFLYTSKSSRRERNAGCEGLPEQFAPKGNFEGRDMDNPKNHLGGLQGSHMSNNHPTVKPLALMRWLVRLVTPPDGIVLDPFAGSGSTLVAAIQEGYHFIGIEAEEEYVKIAEARIAHARREV